jgi:hypothetical protein
MKTHKKDPAAVYLGSKGGIARAKKLTPEQRSAIAKLGGRPRKDKNLTSENPNLK